jgi:hypothetical protein
MMSIVVESSMERVRVFNKDERGTLHVYRALKQMIKPVNAKHERESEYEITERR